MCRGSVLKAWELIRQCAAAFPPSKTIAAPFSEYLRAQTEDPEISSTLRDLVFAAWKNLDCTVRSGPRLSAPTAEEVEALQEGRTLTCSIFLFDDAVETVPYNVMTTVREALTAVTANLKVGRQGDFGLFEWRTSRSPGSSRAEEATTGELPPHSLPAAMCESAPLTDLHRARRPLPPSPPAVCWGRDFGLPVSELGGIRPEPPAVEKEGFPGVGRPHRGSRTSSLVVHTGHLPPLWLHRLL